MFLINQLLILSRVVCLTLRLKAKECMVTAREHMGGARPKEARHGESVAHRAIKYRESARKLGCDSTTQPEKKKRPTIRLNAGPKA